MVCVSNRIADEDSPSCRNKGTLNVAASNMPAQISTCFCFVDPNILLGYLLTVVNYITRNWYMFHFLSVIF